MTVGILIPIPREFVLTAAANTLAGAELYVYQNLTTTPVTLYSDRACTTPAANPIVSVAGFFPRRYMASAQLLTLSLKTTAGSAIHSDDYVDPFAGGTQTQPIDGTLTALAALSFSGSSIIRATGSDTFVVQSFATDAETRAQTSATAPLTPSNLAGRACFRAHKNGSAQAGIANTTFTKLTFGTEAFDVGACFDNATNYRWTPPAGKVRISASVYVSAGQTTGQVMQLSIYKNGAALADDFIVTGNTFGMCGVTALDDANGTDYYEVYVYLTSGGTGTVSGIANYTYFCGEQI